MCMVMQENHIYKCKTRFLVLPLTHHMSQRTHSSLSLSHTSVKENLSDWKVFLERLAKFVKCGQVITWNANEEGVLMLDVNNNNVELFPSVHHFRSYTFSQGEEYLEESWQNCLRNE